MVTAYLAPHRASCWPGCRCLESDPGWGSRTPPLDCPRPPPCTLSSWQSWMQRQGRFNSTVRHVYAPVRWSSAQHKTQHKDEEEGFQAENKSADQKVTEASSHIHMLLHQLLLLRLQFSLYMVYYCPLQDQRFTATTLHTLLAIHIFTSSCSQTHTDSLQRTVRQPVETTLIRNPEEEETKEQT